MGERPILFSGPMVRAILEGRKTQTRRVLAGGNVYDDISSEALEDFELRGYLPFARGETMNAAKVRFAIGDRLWVRETWAPLDALTHNDPGAQALADRGFYRADEGTVDGEIERWLPAIHMPRWASRLTLAVTDVRVERLQDISEADAIAEGCGQYASSMRLHRDRPFDASLKGSYREGFSELWEGLNAARGLGWDGNPWVVAVTFEAMRANIDFTPSPLPQHGGGAE